MIHLTPVLGAENALFKTIGEIFHPLFVAIAYVLAAIYGVVPNYAVAIAILTIVIMAILTPLTVKSTKSMLKMQTLQPEMQKLRQKYKGAENREQLNQEMMRLYREHGVSPTGGCLPMFLQMPALIVLYDVIRGLTNTVNKGTKLATGAVCHHAVCATPRYIPHTSAMYHNLVKTPGVMESFGINFAAKPFTHHGAWPAYIPYFVFVVVAVGLQYFQMAQMTKRNRGNTAVPSQMQTMQRVMPLIFAYIYFIVPAGVVIYMIVSSAIRVLTQDLIFRFGLVELPGERKIGGQAKSPPPRGLLGRAAAVLAPPRQEAGGGPPEDLREKGGGATGAPPKGAAKSVGRQGPSKAAGQRAPGGQKAGGAGGGGGRTTGRAPANGTAPNGSRRKKAGNTGGTTPPEPKPHPRSKSKRARKAR